MALTHRPIDQEAAEHVIRHPSAVHLAEMENNGSLDLHIERLRSLIASGDADGSIGELDGVPIAMLLHWPVAAIDGVAMLRETRRIAFIASEQLFQCGARGVVFGTHYLKDLRRDHPGTVFIAINGAQHPKIPRWLTLLGFRVHSSHNGLNVLLLGETHVRHIRTERRRTAI